MTMTPLRRGSAAAAALLGVSLALTACGSDGDDAGASDAAAETHSVTADNGTIEVPVHPKRVVTIGGTAQPFIDLGGKPVGVTPYYQPEMLPEDQQATFEAATDIGSDEIDIEKVASLKPDLILFQDADTSYDKIGKQLEAIAPTVFWGLDTEWKTMADSIADAGDVTAELDQQKKEFEDSVTGIQTKYADVIKDDSFVDVSVGSWQDPGMFYIADIGCSEVGRDDVGLNLPEAAAGADPLAYTDLPFEQLSSLSKYDVITYPVDEDGKPTEAFAPVLETNTWKALPAVKAGRAVGLFCPGNGSYGQVNRYLASLDSALATLPAQG
ncbi:MAG: ABC transporter substrate-binding protein [Nocardioides sp.]|uniref:ABC transporter substrate-binding protein n=1 Tax=Nocardioides sp. TaxID=35761 RepID=UPI0039E59175